MVFVVDLKVFVTGGIDFDCDVSFDFFVVF